MAAGPATNGRMARTPPTAEASGPASVPRLADGVELLGEYQDSGYSQPPSLVRRPDGQVIQMSPLLYRVACRIDGSREPAWGAWRRSRCSGICRASSTAGSRAGLSYGESGLRADLA
jgi:hypothetical protein